MTSKPNPPLLRMKQSKLVFVLSLLCIFKLLPLRSLHKRPQSGLGSEKRAIIKWSCRTSHARISRYKLKRNDKGETELHRLCQQEGKLDLIRQLLLAGHPVDVEDKFEFTALHEACNYGHAGEKCSHTIICHMDQI